MSREVSELHVFLNDNVMILVSRIVRIFGIKMHPLDLKLVQKYDWLKLENCRKMIILIIGTRFCISAPPPPPSKNRFMFYVYVFIYKVDRAYL